MFFQGRDPVYKTMRRLVKHLTKAKIPYAVAGGMAVNAHRYQRTTADVDVLLTPQGFAEFGKLLVGKHYKQESGKQRRFTDTRSSIRVDVLVTGLFPGSGRPGPIAFPDPTKVGQIVDGVCVLNLATLIELKLAARRHRDFGDVVELIRLNGLDDSFAAQLHSSVRRDYIECLEEKRREDEYEAREA